MRPVCAVLRVGNPKGHEIVNVSAGDQTQELARELALSCARAAAQQLKKAGVYRLRIDGASNNPDIKVTRIADADETVAVATVLREADESVAVTKLRLSQAEGTSIEDHALESAITEGVASCAHSIPIGEERAVEIVIPVA